MKTIIWVLVLLALAFGVYHFVILPMAPPAGG